jgi:hypothetical protein
MADSDSVVLHQSHTNFLLWLMPVFAVLGCLLVAMALGLPTLLAPSDDPGIWVSIGLAFCGGLALPIGAVLLWLLLPAVTTRYYPARNLVELEYIRPLRRTVKQYPVPHIADVGTMSIGTRNHALALYLRSGEKVRLGYGATSDTATLQAQAARIRATIGVGPTATIGI